MKHSTNYIDTFIAVADDCPAIDGEIPDTKGEKKSVAALQFERLIEHPYTYTSDDVIFDVFAQRKDLSPSEYTQEREQFFSKGQPCLRASPLTKRYGWGVHSNAEGKIALYACNSEEYKTYLNNPSLKVVKAMKSKR